MDVLRVRARCARFDPFVLDRCTFRMGESYITAWMLRRKDGTTYPHPPAKFLLCGCPGVSRGVVDCGRLSLLREEKKEARREDAPGASPIPVQPPE